MAEQVLEPDISTHTETETDTDNPSGKPPNWRELGEGSTIIGFEDHKSKILELLDTEGNDSKCSVISMVGMGGIGKTTLAWTVYDDVEVKRHFEVYAWVNVTQAYTRENLFKDMLKEFFKSALQSAPSEFAQMDEASLIDHVSNFLEDKRYLIVFDDVWDLELWQHVKNALPNNGKGSKVILTTRNESVALTWKGLWINNYIYNLKLLSSEKSWELFCNKAFQGDNGSQCPHHLEDIAHSIVDKCERLPLALVTIGGLLSTKDKVLQEWERFHDSLSIEFERNPQLSNILRILLLSFNDLPNFLKPCFLYFGMFPKSSSVECNRLIKLWIGEDFVEAKDGIALEDVAKENLLELIQRNLVQVFEWYDSGRARTFRVHDLIFETLCAKLRETNFCQILEVENPEVNTQSKRLSIQEVSLADALNGINSESGIQSVLLFRSQEASGTLLSSSVLKKVNQLKVLDLQGAHIEQIPEDIGELVHLQYLSFRYTKVKTIPKSIGKLQNLLTLDLKRCPVEELPVEICNLTKLRHLVVYQNNWDDTLKIWVIGAVKVPEGAIGHLQNLQKLADVNVASSVGFMDQLVDLTEVKYLAISNVKMENSWALCKAIEKLHSLESLNITADYDSNEPLDLQHVNSPPTQLQRLYLTGPLKEFPDWIGRLENLNKLRFKGSKLKDVPFDILQNLPNLTMLGINKDVYYGERLVFQAGGFKKLKAMYFDGLLNLNSVEIQKGALSLLDNLLIHRCPQLKEVPLGFQYLENLTTLKIVEMPEEFVESIGSLPHLVKHIPDIRLGYQSPPGHYIYQKL